MKYLEQDFSFDGIVKFYTEKLEPLKHKTHEGDFMGMCDHDIPCHVCFDNHAMICKEVSSPPRVAAHKRWSVQPCQSCQDKGFMTVKMPKFLRRFFK